jgi:hypothetical protein
MRADFTPTRRQALVGLKGAREMDLARGWDLIALRDAEPRVMTMLAILAPIERITMVQHPFGGRRTAMVRLAGQSAPVPLASLGDGVRRLLQIAIEAELAALASTQVQHSDPPLQRILLVDELDSGVHFSALPSLWGALLRLAEQRGVQVFATTHSWDCA